MAALSFPEFGDASLADVPDQSRLPGFEAGVIAGRQQAEAAQTALTEDLIQSIRELRFGYDEAHRAILAQLRPTLTGIVQSVLPSVVDASFVDRVTEELEDACHGMIGNSPLLTVHPDNLDAIASALANHDLNISVQSNAAVSERTATIDLGDTLTTLDLSDHLQRVADLCDDYFNLTTERSAHG